MSQYYAQMIDFDFCKQSMTPLYDEWMNSIFSFPCSRRTRVKLGVFVRTKNKLLFVA